MIIWILTFLTSVSAWASSFPEYGHFVDGERLEINSPRRIGSEYESDRLTYQFLTDWHFPWMKEDTIFQYTAGSLGPTRFLTQGRFRFRKRINDKFEFQLSYVENGDFKGNRETLIFEFLYSWNDWLQFSIYGDPATLKKEDDAGFASVIHFNETSRLRIFYTMADFSHNKRNEDQDTFNKVPGSFGFVWRAWEEDSREFIEAYYREDKDTEQFFPADNRTYIFGGRSLGFTSRQSLDDQYRYFWQNEIRYQRSYEGDNVNTDQGVDRWDYENFDWLMQIEDKQSFVSLWGLRFVYSQWDSTQGNVIHNALLPHAWASVYENIDGDTLQAIDLGYEFTWHRGQGDSSLRDGTDTNNNLEHRMNVRYRINVSDTTRFNLLLTFDLDDFGTGETWEGGAMQYSMTF